jgi:hypothetical protein
MANGPTENTQTQKSNFFADLPSNILGLPIDIISEGLNIFRPQERDFRTQFSPENTVNPVLGSQNIRNLLGGTSDVILGATDAGLKGAGFYGLPTTLYAGDVQEQPSLNTITQNNNSNDNGDTPTLNAIQGNGAAQTAPTATTVAQPQLTTVPGLEGGFGGMSLSQFLEPVRAEREAARSAFEQASREREARLAQEERIRAAQRTGSKAAIDAVQESIFGESKGGGLGDYMSLARQAGAKGGAVKTMAEQLRTQAEQQAATTQAELETEAKKQDTYQARIDALQEEKPDESTAAIGRIDNLISRGILPDDKRSEAILSELGLDPNELLGSGIGFDPSTLSAKDKEAYDFAIKNPEDSRSKEILERLGAS